MADATTNNGYFGENSWRAAVQLIKDALAGVATPEQVEAALTSQKTEIMTEINNVKESIKNQVTDSKGEAGGLAGLDETGKVPVDQLPTGTAGGVAGLDEDGKVPTSNLPTGVANGVTPLDETGKVPSQYLPSYVDDVIEGTLGSDGVFMSIPDPDVEGSVAQAITGEKGKIYVDVTTNFSYRWSGTTYVKIESNDLVEITADDVQAMWDEISAKADTPETGA